jgi:ATP-dependent RNA helicase RhlE
VATDIAARGIDVVSLGHVVNFDVPRAPDDYIHRVGRTGRADAIGDAFTFVSPEEEAELRNIERAVGKRLPRVIVPDFDYKARPEGRLEVPLAARLAAGRAKRTSDHGRSSGRGNRRPTHATSGQARPAAPRPGSGAGGSGAGRRGRRTGRPGSRSRPR